MCGVWTRVTATTYTPRRMRRAILGGVLALSTLATIACDSVTPVAPEGTVLTVSVSPTFITLNGTAQVTVVAREASGQPVNLGVEIFFSTTLGTIDQMAETDASGIAREVLRGDGRPGDAVITVTSGAAAAVISDPVQIGAFAALISLQVSPTVVLEDGGTLDLLALVRDDRGALLPAAVVNFGTEFGILASGGAGITTDQAGEARDTLAVSPADVISAGNGFLVSATTAAEGGVEVLATFTVAVTRLEPIASFTFSLLGNRQVVFTNESTGGEPLRFSWEFRNSDGDLQGDSTQRNPTFTFPDLGGWSARSTGCDVSPLGWSAGAHRVVEPWFW